MHFSLQMIMTFGGNNFNYFCDNQLTEFNKTLTINNE